MHIEHGVHKEIWPETVGNCLKFQIEGKKYLVQNVTLVLLKSAYSWVTFGVREKGPRLSLVFFKK